MSFYSKYEILALLRDDAPSTGVKTFSARHLASGQTVGVHLLFENVPGQTAAVLDRVRSLGPEQVSQVIEVGDHEGTSYVVTAQSIWPRSFDEWLGKPPAPAAPTKASADNYGKAGNWRVSTPEFIRKSDPGATPAAAATPIPEPGGFTRMFSISPRSAAGGEMSTSSVLLPSAIRPVPSQAPFVPIAPPAFATTPPQTVPPAANPPSPVVPATPAASLDLSGETRKLEVSAVIPAAPPSAAGPGEFTRMFQVPASAPVPAVPPSQDDLSVTKTMRIPLIPAVIAPPVPPPAPPPPTAPPPPLATAPGEFTQMFQAMPQQTTPSQVTPIAKAPAPGEFTQMFQTAAPAATPSTITPILNRSTMPPAPSPAPPAAAPGDFTNIFKTGVAPAQQPPPQPPPAGGPGEFTRIFQTSAVRPTGEAPPVQQPPPPPDSGPGEFTKFFQTPVESPAPRPHPALNDPFGKSAPPPTAPQSGGPGEFTQMFGVPSRPSQGGAPEPYKPAYSPSFAPPPSSSATGAFSTPSRPPSAPSTGGPPAGPGEYTQMFSAPSQPSTLPAPPAPPAAATPNYLPLVIIFGVLFLIAAVLVVYFVMHR